MYGFHVINLGCKVNRVEADALASALIAAGAQQVALNVAELVIINTCTVTGEADTKSRKAVHRAVAMPHTPQVIVCGCGVVGNAAQFEGLGARVALFANKAHALEAALALLATAQAKAPILPEPSKPSKPSEPQSTTPVAFSANAPAAPSAHERARVAVKVQDGCNNSCTYCIVPTVRGAARSLRAEEILNTVASLAQSGTREIVLTGIDLGAWQEGSHRLNWLLAAALEAGEGFRLRLSSIELLSVNPGLIELMAASKGRLCAHLHVPLQSGADAVLKAMGRLYDSGTFLAKIAEFRATLPHLALTTDVIAGFPGETEEDFAATVALCQQAGFAGMHVFKYSKRAGTPAAQLPGQVPAEVKAARAATLRSLGATLAQRAAQARLGTTEQVLIERTGYGRTESYLLVRTPASCKRGELVTMELAEYADKTLSAVPFESRSGSAAAKGTR